MKKDIYDVEGIQIEVERTPETLMPSIVKAVIVKSSLRSIVRLSHFVKLQRKRSHR